MATWMAAAKIVEETRSCRWRLLCVCSGGRCSPEDAGCSLWIFNIACQPSVCSCQVPVSTCACLQSTAAKDAKLLTSFDLESILSLTLKPLLLRTPLEEDWRYHHWRPSFRQFTLTSSDFSHRAPHRAPQTSEWALEKMGGGKVWFGPSWTAFLHFSSNHRF